MTAEPSESADPDSPEHAVIVLEYRHPEFGLFMKVVEEIKEVLTRTEESRPRLIHVGINEVALDVLNVFEKEKGKMGLRKHGEGEVIPETEQQKTAAQQGSQMSEADREALRAENEAADGAKDDE